MDSTDTRTPVAMASKPSFLGLLNEISEAERRGHDYLTVWADRCHDANLGKVLLLVAAREAEHSASFARRIVELGYRVRPREDTAEEVRNRGVAASDLDDVATFEALGYRGCRDPDAPDIFDRYFTDHSIDPTTGALLGRFIAEERDSARRLQQAYEELKARVGGPRPGS